MRFCLHGGNVTCVVEYLESGLDIFGALFNYPDAGRYKFARLPRTEAWAFYFQEGVLSPKKELLSSIDIVGRFTCCLRTSA